MTTGIDRSITGSDANIVRHARRYLEKHPYDTNLPVFMVRDLPVTDACDLSGLVRVMYQQNDATVDEVIEILDKLDAKLKGDNDDA